KWEIMDHLDRLGDDEKVMLKLTIPTKTNAFKELIDHPNVIRVVALSGGYERDDANEKLKQNDGLIARSEERRVGRECRTRKTRSKRDWSSDVCSSDLEVGNYGSPRSSW